jgi:hypothetical protein
MVDSCPVWLAVVVAVAALSLLAWLCRRDVAVWLGFREENE